MVQDTDKNTFVTSSKGTPSKKGEETPSLERATFSTNQMQNPARPIACVLPLSLRKSHVFACDWPL